MRQFLGGAALKATSRLANDRRQERCAVAKGGCPSYSPGSLKPDEIQIYILRIVPFQTLFLPPPSFKLSFPTESFLKTLFVSLFRSIVITTLVMVRANTLAAVVAFSLVSVHGFDLDVKSDGKSS